MFGHRHHSHPRSHGCIGRDGEQGHSHWGRSGWGRGGFGPGGFGPGGFGGGFGGGHRGGPRGGRPFDQGDLRLLLLDLIAEKPRHGYELIKAIEEAMQGAYSPSPGVVYPTLTLLEETGLIVSEAQGPKKLYSLTDEGRQALETEAQALAAAKGRMEAARERMGPPPAAEIGRAMQNLGMALAGRLRGGPLPKETLQKVVDAIDAAAREIERS